MCMLGDGAGGDAEGPLPHCLSHFVEGHKGYLSGRNYEEGREERGREKGRGREEREEREE